jgi:hypothetical protein
VDPAGPAPITIASKLYLWFIVSELVDYQIKWKKRSPHIPMIENFRLHIEYLWNAARRGPPLESLRV